MIHSAYFQRETISTLNKINLPQTTSVLFGVMIRNKEYTSTYIWNPGTDRISSVLKSLVFDEGKSNRFLLLKMSLAVMMILVDFDVDMALSFAKVHSVI